MGLSALKRRDRHSLHLQLPLFDHEPQASDVVYPARPSSNNPLGKYTPVSILDCESGRDNLECPRQPAGDRSTLLLAHGSLAP